MKQQSLASLTNEGMKKRTKREKLLQEMERLVPWARLLALIVPHRQVPVWLPEEPLQGLDQE